MTWGTTIPLCPSQNLTPKYSYRVCGAIWLHAIVSLAVSSSNCHQTARVSGHLMYGLTLTVYTLSLRVTESASNYWIHWVQSVCVTCGYVQ